MAYSDKLLDAQRRILDIGAARERAEGQPLRVGGVGERGVRIARRQAQVLYEPPTRLSISGMENQAVDVDQIMGIITDLCTEGFTLHSAGACTLWFAIETA